MNEQFLHGAGKANAHVLDTFCFFILTLQAASLLV